VTAYALYLESGPQKKTTMVHVPELLGCIANGPTTDAALAATPDAIRAYLGYLRRHGADVDSKAPIETRVAEHITTGQFLGRGSPDAIYEPDLRPLTPSEVRTYAAWLEWSRADLLKLVKGLDDRALDAKPKGSGRPIRNILKHVLEAEKGYVYSVLGVTKSLHVPTSDALHDRVDIREGLRLARRASIARVLAMTPQERRAVTKRGSSTRTARRMLRRMLEHEWEHRREIAARLGAEA
jgi:uncharacterized damage-inducible protein DinB/predicted RNase H-like HicB family nuclease